MCKFIISGGALALFLPAAVTQQAAPQAKDVLQRTLAAYSSAKTYHGTWSFVTSRGDASQTMSIEIKSKAPNKLWFRVSAPPGQKTTPDLTTIPEMMVVVDGKTAWFYNVSDNAYFRVALPEKAQISPLMFIPQIKASTAVRREPDRKVEGKTILTVQAGTADGGKTRMEVDGADYHIVRIVKEEPLGASKITSTISVQKETFGSDAPDSEFSFKPPRGVKEVPPSLGAAALFGSPG